MRLAEISEILGIRELMASIFQDRGVDPGPMDRTTDVPGARNRIATDPGQVRGVRQTAGPSAQRRVLYARASAVLRTLLACVLARRVYEQLREQRREKKKEQGAARKRDNKRVRDEARKASSRSMRRDNDGRI